MLYFDFKWGVDIQNYTAFTFGSKPVTKGLLIDFNEREELVCNLNKLGFIDNNDWIFKYPRNYWRSY